MSLTKEQQEARRGRVGSSEIAAIVGLSPWKSKFDIWTGHTGRAIELEQGAVHIKRGDRMEPVLIGWLGEDTGLSATPNKVVHVHPEIEVAAATPDAFLVSTTTHERVIGEVKSPGWRMWDEWGSPGTAQIPEDYLCQVQWQMGVTGLNRAMLGADLAEFSVYEIRHNSKFFWAMVEEAERYWRNHVMADKPPKVEDTRYAKEWLKRTYPEHNPNEWAQADTHTNHLIAEWRRLKGIVGKHVKLLDGVRRELELFIGGREGIESAEYGRITYRKRKNGTATDWQAIAEELRAPQSLIEKHTRVVPGYRAMRAPKEWKMVDDE